MKKTVLVMAFLALVSFTTAQPTEGNVDTAIVASSANYPDAMIGAAASDKIGAPVLLTDKDSLSDSTANALNNLGVSEVVILGGPSVVSESVEAEIDSEVESSTRLWGVSEIGTSVQVSEYFWTESDEATVVQYPLDSEKAYSLLSAVKDEVQDEDEPVLISKPGTISASTLSEVERLGASEVEVYSTETVNVTQDLEDIGVEEVKVNEGTLEELSTEVENRKEANTSNLIVVAATNFRDSLSVPNTAKGSSVTVSSEAEIGNAVTAAAKASVKNVKVVGNNDLANQIAERIRNETEKNVEVASGSPEDVSAEQAQNNKANWSQIQNERLPNWKEQVRNSKGLETAANRTLEKAESTVNENSSERARELLSEARKAFDEGDFFKARKKSTAAISQANMNSFKELGREGIRAEYRSETEDLRSAVKGLSEDMRGAETVEEKLEAVKEFREKRKSMRKSSKASIFEPPEAKGPPGPGGLDGGDESSSEDSDESNSDGEGLAAGESELEFSVEGSTVSSKMTFMAKNSGYSVNTNSNADGRTVTFNYEISSSSNAAASVLTELDSSVSKTDLSPSNYTAKAVVSVDGDTVNTASDELTVEG